MTSTANIDLDAGRRGFIQSLAACSVGASILAAAEGTTSNAQAQSISDKDILNFALNLEYLGATYYLTALTSQGLSANDIGTNPGTVTGGRQVNWQSSIVQSTIVDFAYDERAHVQTLRAALGTDAISRPNLDIGPAFTQFAYRSGYIKPAAQVQGVQFDPYSSDTNFLLGAYIFEDVCVTALVGAAALLKNKANVAIASGFLAVEGYQAGAIRAMLFAQQSANSQMFTETASDLRSSLANNGNFQADDYFIGSVASPHLVPLDSNALAFARTSRQVLNIVYGAANTSSGLFFPSGFNGAIR